MAALLRAAGVSRTASKAMQQTRGYKVAVLGAAGSIGQPCGLLMNGACAPDRHGARGVRAIETRDDRNREPRDRRSSCLGAFDAPRALRRRERAIAAFSSRVRAPARRRFPSWARDVDADG